MKIAFISSEAVPYAKTGGLGDVAGVLPKVLEQFGCEVKLFIPKYSTIDEDKFNLHYNWEVGEMPIRINGITRSVHLHQAVIPNSNVEVNFIDCPHYFNRGSIYTTHLDEDERFILFSKGVIETLQRLNWGPDIIHCNDWQTGLIPLLIRDNYSWDKFFHNTATIFTIHNIGYQGRFHRSSIYKAEIKEKYYYPGGPIEFENSFSFMKSAISFSDIITTVSKTYAQEILTPQYGSGLDGALFERRKDLYGILNGIDYSIWDPETDKYLPYKYSKNDLTGKLENKKFLLEHFKLKYDEKVPLIGIISRMVLQKGFDIVVEAALGLMDLKTQWVILGNGEDRYEDFFTFLCKTYMDKVSVHIGFNTELSHLIEAGADMFLMPSLYEPCGLNQMYSLKYGTVPIVRKTGGLADTVKDWDELKYHGDESGNGFSFNDYSGYALMTTTQRAVNYFQNKDVWNKIQLNGMKQDHSWEVSAQEYIKVYEKAKLKRSV
ncbi:MAG TPA: glycogen/starch synthase [Ignavibacteriaceae bacterium]|nr:glycogen/starch synthase [Ignavibacteriaceae bacterium]